MATKSTTTKKSTTNKKKKSTSSKTNAKKSTSKNTNKKKVPVKKTSTKKTTNKKTTSNKKKSTTSKSSKATNTPKKTTIKKISTPTKVNTKNIEKKKNKINIITKLEIILLTICKVVLTFIKNIKKFIVRQYNRVVHGSVSKNKKIKKQKQNSNKKLDENDELVLLRYRDYRSFAKITVFFINRFRVMKFDMKRFKKKFKYGTLKDKILILLMLILIAGFSCVIAFCVYIVVTAPEISTERLYKQSSSILLDVDGNEFARLGTENREKVTYDELPQVLIDAIVSAEDSRFFQHNGVDIARFTKAVIGQLSGNSDAGGGSTITMQVSKNAATSTTSSGIKGIIRKFQDIYLSVFVFEKKYTKEQILEFYVNIPYLGSGTYGVQQAAKTYFGKDVSELTLVEAATIAGLFQSPGAYDPNKYPQAAENRRNTILNLMYRHGYITEEECETAKAVPLESLLVETSSSSNVYQDFIDTVVEEIKDRTGLDPTTTSMTVYTTMNPEKQDVVNDIMNGVTYTWKNDYAQAGIAVVSVEDGSLVAVGASRDKGQLVFNYATSISRHPGSTAKPVLDYGPAIEYLNWSTGTTVIDDEYTYTGGGYIRNFDSSFKGIMTAKTALAQSRNIPALYTFQQTTNEQKLEFSNNLGWHAEDSTGYINESASIGGFNGVSPVQAAAAYATFARGGTYIEPYSYTKIELTETGETMTVTPKKVQAMSESTAYLITVILKYAVTSGSVTGGSVSGTDIAAKTGTSTVDSAAKKAAGITDNVIGDSWTNTFSPDYAISLWYGYDNQLDKEHHLTNSEGGTARKTITKLLSAGIYEKNSRFTQPSTVVTAEIELETDPLELASEYTPSELRSVEYFKEGTVPTETSTRFSKLSDASNLKYSASGSTVTLSWDAAPTPDAINVDYLTEYFNNNVYKTWADKYLQKRLEYNSKTFGSFGYEIYMVTSSGTTDLGFTTNTTFTTNVSNYTDVKFIVKASYQYFKSNQSDGISVTVEENNSTIEEDDDNNNNTETTSFSIEFNHSCVTVDSYNALGTSPSDKIKVTSNGTDVTSSTSISAACFTTSGDGIDCNKMVNGTAYNVKFGVTYKGLTRYKQISIKASCS